MTVLSEQVDGDIVKYIVDFLKPWKPQRRQIETGEHACEMEFKSEADLKAEISNAVAEQLSRLQTIVPSFLARTAIEKTRHDARDLIETIDELQRLLLSKTLSPELRIRLGDDGRPVDPSVDINNLPVPRLLDALNNVRQRCQAADENQPQRDEIKFWCATKAIGLILKYSEKRPRAGSVKTPYCTIAGLLYQGVTGEEQSLRGVCQDVLRPYLSLPGWH